MAPWVFTPIRGRCGNSELEIARARAPPPLRVTRVSVDHSAVNDCARKACGMHSVASSRVVTHTRRRKVGLRPCRGIGDAPLIEVGFEFMRPLRNANEPDGLVGLHPDPR